MTTIGAQITSEGILVPDYADILQQLKILFWQIYGSDADLSDDSPDGQFLAVLAQIVYDSGLMVQAAYNGFAPSSAQGVQLSRLVKLNGLARDVPSNSTAVVTITGTVGTEILTGVVGDNQNLSTRWSLPDTVTIPISGTIDVTATCQTEGAVSAAAGTLTRILTPTRGWQGVTNAEAAALGLPVESDAELRARQTQSTSLPALSVLDSIYASIAAIEGVSRLTIYENDTDITDGNGIPSHSISAVVSGGDSDLIAQAIALKKTPGSGTYGSTEVEVVDPKGLINTIRYYPLALTELAIEIHITALSGYVSTTGDALVQAVADFVNALSIGEDSYLSRLYTPANLTGTGLGATYVVTAITQAIDGNPLLAQNIAIAFNAGAHVELENINLVTS